MHSYSRATTVSCLSDYMGSRHIWPLYGLAPLERGVVGGCCNTCVDYIVDGQEPAPDLCVRLADAAHRHLCGISPCHGIHSVFGWRRNANGTGRRYFTGFAIFLILCRHLGAYQERLGFVHELAQASGWPGFGGYCLWITPAFCAAVRRS